MRDWEAFLDLSEQNLLHATEAAGQALDHFERTGEHWGSTYALHALAGAAIAEGRAADALKYYRQSTEKCREIGYRRGLQFALTGLGDASAAAGDLEGADGYYLECLELSHDLGQARETLAMMLRIAEVRAAMGHAEQAIELISAVLADPVGSQQMPAQPVIHGLAEEMRAKLEQELGPDAYTASWARGRSRTTDAAAEGILATTFASRA